ISPPPSSRSSARRRGPRRSLPRHIRPPSELPTGIFARPVDFSGLVRRYDAWAFRRRRIKAMKYMLLIWGEQGRSLSETEREQIYAGHRAYGEAMTKAGVIRGGAELKPP